MSSQENESSNDYLKLKTSASLIDLILFIVSFDLGNIKNLVDCPPNKQQSYRSFGDRWIIVSSIFLQKLILLVATFQNSQLFNKMRAETFGMHPKNNAPKVKCRDWRIEMGKNLNLSGDNIDFSYYSSLTIMASALAYEDSPVVETVVNDCWQMKEPHFYNFWNDVQKKPSTQAFTFQNTTRDPNVTVVAFRGSSESDDWSVDVDCSWFNIDGIGNIHHGFMLALGLQNDTNSWPKNLPPRSDRHEFAYYTLRQKLTEIAKGNDDARFIITGHSLGGALATLFVTILAFHDESALLRKVQAVYTFGQPRVGNKQFAHFMESVIKKYGFKYYRCVYSFDMIPRVPFDIHDSWFKHVGGCVHYDCCYKAKFTEDKRNDDWPYNISVLPCKYLTAWWELIRSLITYIKGRDNYFEGLTCLMLRVFGLFLPGAPAHMCINYINSTRYGNLKNLQILSKTKNK